MTPEDPLWSFVTTSRAAFTAAANIADAEWESNPDNPVEGTSIVRCTTISSCGKEITVAKVTQHVGVVIPPHRHHESHVLLKVTAGTIQVDCEGYSRPVETGQECLIPMGFTHSVFTLAKGGFEPAVYLSAHFEKFLTLDNNRFLAKWPDGKTELDVSLERISWFLSLQPEYLDTDKHSKYRAWFYLLHFDEDQSLQEVAAKGFAGCWGGHQDLQTKIEEYESKPGEFRVGNDLSQPIWQEKQQYSPLFVAHRDKLNAEKFTEYFAWFNSYKNKWVLVRPSGVEISESEGFSDGTFQSYMKLLMNDFMPDTEYAIYMTPPQRPGNSGSGYVEDCQRRPFSSCVVGMTHGRPEFLIAMFSYYLLCSSMMQQIRFAVRSDVNKIRHNEDKRTAFFKDVFIDSLKLEG